MGTLVRTNTSTLLLAALLGACASSSTPPPQVGPPATSAPEASRSAEPVAAPTEEQTSSTEKVAPNVPQAITQAVQAEDRAPADRALDVGRHPLELLTFSGIKPGDRVAELAAGGGYTAELLARVVGTRGVVYGQNHLAYFEKFGRASWDQRLEKPVMKNVVPLERELDDPLSAEANNLDAVFFILFYHDTVWMKTNRAQMNRAIFDALKPGGVYIVVDHSAPLGAGVSLAQTLHRIEKSVVVREVEAAGFVLEQSADFLENPLDAKNWNASPLQAGEQRGRSDRFVLKFVKPLETATKGGARENESAEPHVCTEPRRSACTREYQPVCAQVDTGVRCIQAPCPSTAPQTYGNGCSACADPKVVTYTLGACSTPEAKP